jgi:hypothetical protein
MSKTRVLPALVPDQPSHPLSATRCRSSAILAWTEGITNACLSCIWGSPEVRQEIQIRHVAILWTRCVPSVAANERPRKQLARCPSALPGPVSFQEPQDFPAVTIVSRANQPTPFQRISRWRMSWRTPRLGRADSSRSTDSRPSQRSTCSTPLRTGSTKG